jgi:hypothetical protein
MRMGKTGQHITGTKAQFFIKIQRRSVKSWMTVLPPSFDYLNRNELLTLFYSRKYEIKLKTDKELNPL